MAQIFSGSSSDMSRTFHLNGSASILVGNNRPLPGSNPANGCSWNPGSGGHALSFGMTRSGKGLQIISALTQYSASVVVIDPKGENAWTTAERRRQMGQRVVILDPFDEVNRRYASLVGKREATTRFNPLSIIDPKSPDYSEDLFLLADAIIISSGGENPHWPDSARQLLAALMAATVEQAPPGQATFREVRQLLTATDKELSQAIDKLLKKNPNSLAGRLLRRFAPKYDKKGNIVISGEISSIRSTADTQTQIFESVRLLNSMDDVLDLPSGSAEVQQPFDLRELATGRVSLFLVLPVDRLGTYGRWLRMIITLTIRAITRHPVPPDPPVLFILDELGTINPGGGLQVVRQSYGLMAGMGIRIWGFLQDLKQLQDDYPTAWETFIANSDMIQLLKVNDNTTLNYFSEFIGIHEVISASLGGSQEKRLMRPDQIKELAPKMESLVLFSGGRNFHMARVNYFTDPRLVGRFRPNPQYKTPPTPAALPAYVPLVPVVRRQPVSFGKVVLYLFGAFACFSVVLIALFGMGVR